MTQDQADTAMCECDPDAEPSRCDRCGLCTACHVCTCDAEQDEPTTTADLRKAAALLRETPALVIGSEPLAAWLEQQARRSALPFNEGDCDPHALTFARELLTHTTGKATT